MSMGLDISASLLKRVKMRHKVYLRNYANKSTFWGKYFINESFVSLKTFQVNLVMSNLTMELLHCLH